MLFRHYAIDRRIKEHRHAEQHQVNGQSGLVLDGGFEELHHGVEDEHAHADPDAFYSRLLQNGRTFLQ